MRLRRLRATLLFCLTLCLLSGALVGPAAEPASPAGASCADGDWPQLQHDAKRTGYNPIGIIPPYVPAWRVTVDDYFAEVAQPIVSAGRIMACSKRGVLYSWDAATGKTAWTNVVGAPMVHAAAAENGRVFTAALNGRVCAWDITSGKKLWEFQTSGSIYVAPVCCAARVLLGNTAGDFYALDQADGRVVWETAVGAPIIQSAASDEERVYVGDESMMFHALAVQTGKEVWKKQLYGESFYEGHPVVAGDKVMTMTVSLSPSYPNTKDAVFNKLLQCFVKHPHQNPSGPDFPVNLRKAQEEVSAILAARPRLRTFYVMDVRSGEEPYVPAVTHTGSNTSIQSAPILCGNTDSVFLMYCTDCAYIQMARITLARFDLTVGRVVETFIKHVVTTKPYWSCRSGTYDPVTWEFTSDKVGRYVGDEHSSLTAVPGYVLRMPRDCIGVGKARGHFDVRMPAGNEEWDISVIPAGDFVYSLDSYPTGSTLYAVKRDPKASRANPELRNDGSAHALMTSAPTAAGKPQDGTK